jgi:hypothetical protein
VTRHPTPGTVDPPAPSNQQIYQLFGTYLMMKGPEVVEMDPGVHNEKFWLWLKDAGIESHGNRCTIVMAMAGMLSRLICVPSAY